jgi:hypothetical protein
LVDDLPDAFDGLSRTTIAEIFDKLRAGPRPREFYSPHSNAADFWADSPIITIAGKTDEEARRILRTWLQKQVLRTDDYISPRSKRQRPRVLPNEQKAAEILGPLYRPPEAPP